MAVCDSHSSIQLQSGATLVAHRRCHRPGSLLALCISGGMEVGAKRETYLKVQAIPVPFAGGSSDQGREGDVGKLTYRATAAAVTKMTARRARDNKRMIAKVCRSRPLPTCKRPDPPPRWPRSWDDLRWDSHEEPHHRPSSDHHVDIDERIRWIGPRRSQQMHRPIASATRSRYDRSEGSIANSFCYS